MYDVTKIWLTFILIYKRNKFYFRSKVKGVFT